ncbi:MAG: hypothetical protein N2053_06725, partial [Chitinispirillaceae bacterium]|nr:hypothetical protein [Chitinispirillaceae bacterium]
LKVGISNKIVFTGKIDHRELPKFIASHRVGINYMRPSLVNNCRAILKIRENLACGLEVVCNDTGDAAIFKDFIYIEPNVDSMFGAVSKIFSLPSVKNIRGRDFVEKNFDWFQIVSSFEKKVCLL